MSTINNQLNKALSSAPLAGAIPLFDANGNLSANNFIGGYATTVSSGSVITLTVGSAQQQYITGTTAQTLKMPVASTLVLGQSWTIVNNSTATTTIQSSGGNTIVTLLAGSQAIITCILASGTTAASWNFEASSQSGFVGTINRVIITSGTTYSPTSGCLAFIVEGVGGGGGGGGSLGGSTTYSSGSGGGGGGYFQSFFTGTLSSSYTLSIGSAGTGSSGGSGSNGGSTTFNGTLTAGGGSGGLVGTTSTSATAITKQGGAGGSASGGNINIVGMAGGNSISVLTVVSAGFGGNSQYGNGGQGSANAVVTGQAGTGFGAGGAGGNATTTSSAGGNGTAGAIFITEFNP